MPELRKDPIIGRWVIIATERASRPDQFKPIAEGPQEGPCPFCKGNESQTPPEIYSNKPDWQVRVVPSIAPMLRVEGELDKHGRGVYDVLNGIGAHEVIVETDRHVSNIADLDQEQIALVINAYIERMTDLEKDQRFSYVLAFKNHGWSAGGGRIRHARSQLIATPVIPKRVKEELAGSRHYYEHHERCVYCDLIRQELASKDRLILEVDGFVAIAPFASRFPFEIWVLPKKHSCDFTDLNIPEQKDLARILKLVLTKLKVGLQDPPYNYILHTAPFKRKKTGYWNTIRDDYHWHIEIIPRLTRVAGFEWGTGFYICTLPPEHAAKFLREINEENISYVVQGKR